MKALEEMLIKNGNKQKSVNTKYCVKVVTDYLKHMPKHIKKINRSGALVLTENEIRFFFQEHPYL